MTSEPIAGDLSLFTEMHRVLVGDVIEPISTEADRVAWREREDVVKYADPRDQATRIPGEPDAMYEPATLGGPLGDENLEPEACRNRRHSA